MTGRHSLKENFVVISKTCTGTLSATSILHVNSVAFPLFLYLLHTCTCTWSYNVLSLTRLDLSLIWEIHEII